MRNVISLSRERWLKKSRGNKNKSKKELLGGSKFRKRKNLLHINRLNTSIKNMKINT